jgi:hypothetical protein
MGKQREGGGAGGQGELRARQRKRVAAIRKLNARYAVQAFPMRAAEKWNRLSRELDETEKLITELRARYESALRSLTTARAGRTRVAVTSYWPRHARLVTREERRGRAERELQRSAAIRPRVTSPVSSSSASKVI